MAAGLAPDGRETTGRFQTNRCQLALRRLHAIPADGLDRAAVLCVLRIGEFRRGRRLPVHHMMALSIYEKVTR